MADGKPGRPFGSPKTGGRQKGTRNKFIEALEHTQSTILRDMPCSTALELLQAIYRHPDLPPAMRHEAARSAVRYETPALAAVTHSGHISTKDAEQLTDDDLAIIIASEQSAGGDGASGEAPGSDKPDRVH